MSLDCLTKNNYDSGLCQEAFLNYRNCKKFWVSETHELNLIWSIIPTVGLVWMRTLQDQNQAYCLVLGLVV